MCKQLPEDSVTATAKSTFEAGEDGDLGFEKGETIVVRAHSDSDSCAQLTPHAPTLTQMTHSLLLNLTLPDALLSDGRCVRHR